MGGAGARPVLSLVSDCGADPKARLAQIGAAVAGGVDWVQLRDRAADPADLLVFADALRARCGPGTRLVVNRRLDVALAAGADGIHLGYDALAPDAARACWADAWPDAPPPLLGISTHSVEEATAALRAGAEYVHLAPIFPPLSKPAERPPLGVGALSEVTRDDGPGTVIAPVTATPKAPAAITASTCSTSVPPCAITVPSPAAPAPSETASTPRGGRSAGFESGGKIGAR